MGKRSGCPFVQIPVVNSFTMSASLAGGVPPIRGAFNGQFGLAAGGPQVTGAPSRGRLCSRVPSLFRGVWHCPHIATFSTRYFPRSTSPAAPSVPALAVAPCSFGLGETFRGREATSAAAQTARKIVRPNFDSCFIRPKLDCSGLVGNPADRVLFAMHYNEV